MKALLTKAFTTKAFSAKTQSAKAFSAKAFPAKTRSAKARSTKALSTALLALTLAGSLLLGGCQSREASPAPAATPAKAYKIAIIQHMDHPSLNEIRESIIAELEAQAQPGQIEIITRNTNGDMSLLPTVMQELLQNDVDLLIPIATPAAQTAMGATQDKPIIFAAVTDPVGAKLVTSLEDTDGNITGVSNVPAVEDTLQLAESLTPGIKTLGLIYNSSEINSNAGITRAKAYCQANQIAIKEVIVTNTAEVQQAAAALVGHVNAIYSPTDNTVAAAMATLVQVTDAAKIPVYVGADSMVKDGALATVGVNYTNLGKQVAGMAMRVVEGAAISDIPVEQLAEYTRTLNTATAQRLNVVIPEALKASSECVE